MKRTDCEKQIWIWWENCIGKRNRQHFIFKANMEIVILTGTVERFRFQNSRKSIDFPEKIDRHFPFD